MVIDILPNAKFGTHLIILHCDAKIAMVYYASNPHVSFLKKR